MNYTVEEAFKKAKEYGIVSNLKVFYRWVNKGVVPSVKNGKQRVIKEEDLMQMIHEKLNPFAKSLLEENKKLKEKNQVLLNSIEVEKEQAPVKKQKKEAEETQEFQKLKEEVETLKKQLKKKEKSSLSLYRKTGKAGYKNFNELIKELQRITSYFKAMQRIYEKQMNNYEALSESEDYARGQSASWAYENAAEEVDKILSAVENKGLVEGNF